jgi:hypothetical protein
MSAAAKPKTIWTCAGADEDAPSLVRLSGDQLSLASVPAADLERTVANLEAGGDLACRTIPLATITGVVGEIADGWAGRSVSVTVTYRSSESKTDTATFELARRTDWDELSGVLLGRFGPGWQRKEVRNSPWRVALWPLGVALLVGVVTFWMCREASLIAEGHRLQTPGTGKAKLVRAVMHLIEGWIGPTGVLILGGVLMLACLPWLWYSIAYPGRRVTLKSLEGGAASGN